MSSGGAIACGHPETAAAAEEILRAGGNAFDAVIAAQFAACVTEPVLTSLAGGGFLLARPAGETPRLYDFFAHTPKAKLSSPDALYEVHADFGTTTQAFHIGPASIATPGTVAGMFRIHDELGSLPMAELAAPAIQLARDGVRVDALQAEIFRIVRPIYENVQPFALAQEGVELRQPALADSLEALVREGERLFYDGEIGQRLVGLCRESGGHLSEDDLTGYRVIVRRPLAFSYARARVHINPPPSSGGLLIRHCLSELGAAAPSPLAIARALAATERARPALLAAAGDQVRRGTTHISVCDRAGHLAAMTLSNGEGSGCLIPGTGIMTNNMLGEEDINPEGIGRWHPDRRLGSMMAPTLARSARGQFALGSGGSNRIRSAIAQVLIRLLGDNSAPEDAVAAPRLHVESDLLSLEPGLDPALFTGDPSLPRALQCWPEPNLFFGGVHVVAAWPDGTFSAAGDPRRGGVGIVIER